MSDLYGWIKLLHILSSTVLLGTGLGTAFQMWTAHRSGDARVIARVAQQTVWADALFTTPAVIVQPITGIALAWLAGFSLTTPWLVAAYLLYLAIGACWLPVVWIQLRARDLAAAAVSTGMPLPMRYHQLMRWWFWLGWPAFSAVLAIFWLMVAKPGL